MPSEKLWRNTHAGSVRFAQGSRYARVAGYSTTGRALLDGRVTDDDLLLGGDRQPQDQVEHELGSGEKARHDGNNSYRIAPDAEAIRDASADSGDNFSVGRSSEFSHASSVARGDR